MKLEITRYAFEIIDGQPKIVIQQIKLSDENGKYIKFLKMSEAVQMLADHPVTFRPI